MKVKTDQELWEEIRTNRSMRLKLGHESQYWFFHLYFGENVQHPTAEFQKEIYDLTSDPGVRHVVIVAFRGSAKSTIATLCCPIWSVVGAPQKKFVLLLSQTQAQARVHLQNVKRFLEGSELFRNDFGPVEETSDEWGSTSLFLPKYNARISAASAEQSIRGIRHGAFRPDLIVADDVEDMNSTKTREGREQTYQWFVSEVIPAGDRNTKIINIGNLLHHDSLLMRLKEKIEKGELNAVYREYPIVNSDGQPLWPGKYPDKIAIEEQMQKVVDQRAWLREFMLRIVPDQDQVISQDWISYYDQIPEKNEANEYIQTFIGVDLAISEKQTADCTAITIIHVFGYEQKDRRYFIDQRFINKRMTFMQTIETIENLSAALVYKEKPKILVEDVGYQGAVIEMLQDKELDVKGIKVKGDKYSRLMAASMLFEQARVLFPRDASMKPIISQLVGFGSEKHDDLVDAITVTLNYVHTKVEYGIFCCFVGGDDEDDIYSVFYRD